jgi:hypothetical protein
MLSLRTADIISTFLFFNITQKVEGVNLQSLLTNFTVLTNQNTQEQQKIINNARYFHAVVPLCSWHIKILTKHTPDYSPDSL